MEEYTPTGPARYGDKYWCIKTSISPDGEVYVMADAIEVHGGALMCVGHERQIVLTVAPGEWSAASVMDGSAVAVDRWEGEVIR